jgi:alginate O-acetyltransferase complex protein AlgI
MLFVSAGFLFAFLPLFLLTFMLVPVRAKRIVLLMGSIIFYFLSHLFRPFSVLVLWVSVLGHYFAGILLHRRRDRFLLGLFIAVDLLALVSLR